MIIRFQKKADPAEAGKRGGLEEVPVMPGKEEPCRCKETSEMTPRELINLMIRDLSFWKKKKD